MVPSVVLEMGFWLELDGQSSLGPLELWGEEKKWWLKLRLELESEDEAEEVSIEFMDFPVVRNWVHARAVG